MAAFIMAGPLQALCFVALFALLGLFLPIIGLLSSAAISLITLRLGWQQGLRTALPASLVLIVLSFLLLNDPLPALLPTLGQWLLALLLASVLQHSSSWRQALSVVFAITVAGILLFYLVVSDVEAFWKALMQPLAELSIMQQQFPDLDLSKAIDSAAKLATGMAAALFSLGLTLSLMIGRHWQAVLYNPGGFGQEIRELRLSRAMGLSMIVLITAALLTGTPLLIDMVFAGLAVFLFQGIALTHGIHQQRQMHHGWLIGFYVLLALMPMRFGLLLATFGIIDSIADFRRYLAKPRA